MRTVTVTTGESPLTFEEAHSLARALAEALLGECTCLSWSDRKAGRESPANASDCHGSCEVPGYVEYAVSRGATLRVIVDGGAFDFLFRDLREFMRDMEERP
jgi:hypothetical protein